MEQEPTEYIELPYAGFLSRFAAFVVDYLLISLVMAIVLAIFLPSMFMAEGPKTIEYSSDYVRDLTEAAGPFQYVFFAIWGLYNAIMHASSWQATVGKRAMGIIVTDTDGERLGFGKALLRFLVKLLSTMLLFIGYFFAFFSSRRQTLHDMLAGSVVLRYRIPARDR